MVRSETSQLADWVSMANVVLPVCLAASIFPYSKLIVNNAADTFLVCNTCGLQMQGDCIHRANYSHVRAVLSSDKGSF